ncbi:MAG: hypothetical protein HY057_03515 [Rhodospirillales bacterium]|nr:hypothetical protein [Rhodospirillales bacterium]
MVSSKRSKGTPAETDETVAAPPVAKSGWRAKSELEKLRVIAVTAIAVSGISIAATLTAPWWSPRVLGDPQSGRVLVLAVAQLRPALAGPAPFHTEFTTVRKIVANDPEARRALDGIAAVADTGVPTPRQLTDRLAGLTNQVLVAETFGRGENWIDQVMVKTASVVQLHALAATVGLSGDTHATTIMQSARQRLAAGDLEGAIGEIEKLPAALASLSTPWLKDARARLTADRVLASLDAMAMARMSRLSIAARF